MPYVLTLGGEVGDRNFATDLAVVGEGPGGMQSKHGRQRRTPYLIDMVAEGLSPAGSCIFCGKAEAIRR